MVPDDKIEPLGPYRGIRPVREGSIFAKFKVKRKISSKQQQLSEEEKSQSKKDSNEHQIDIEA